MSLSWKARRRWSLVILLIGLPLYIVAAVTLVNWLDRPPFVVELLVYVGLGFLWALPFRAVFRGVGKADPEAEERRNTGS
jgi:branched-subunit amino acid transport protein